MNFDGPNKRNLYSLENLRDDKVMGLIQKLLPNPLTSVIVPVKYDDLQEYSHDEIQAVMYLLGLYTLPTVELIEWLREQVSDGDLELIPDAIEICCGSGTIGRELEIPITDLKVQEIPQVVDYYTQFNVPLIKYPEDVEKLDYKDAIDKYQPKYVIASYATSKYGLAGKGYGSVYGINHKWVFSHCYKYFFIYNEVTHAPEPILKFKHETFNFPWLITRNKVEQSRIAVFTNLAYKE